MQATLFELETLQAEIEGAEREYLAGGAWIEVHRHWVGGADELLSQLLADVPWRAERRPMYDRIVDVPRLLSFYGESDPLPATALGELKQALDCRYAKEMGEPFATVGMCLYRNGRDSVAWHGDTIGRARTEDTVVAIISLGAPRGLLIRPVGGGSSARRFDLGHGDLFVMGGSFQRTWEHAVPKTSRPVGPRVSVQFRAKGVR